MSNALWNLSWNDARIDPFAFSQELLRMALKDVKRARYRRRYERIRQLRLAKNPKGWR